MEAYLNNHQLLVIMGITKAESEKKNTNNFVLCYIVPTYHHSQSYSVIQTSFLMKCLIVPLWSHDPKSHTIARYLSFDIDHGRHRSK